MDQTRYTQSSDVVLRRVAGESLLIPVKGQLANLQSIFVLEGVGEEVWKRLNGESRLAEIVRDVADLYSVERDVVADDCDEFVRFLLDENLVEEVA